MLSHLFPKAFQRYSSLPLLGPIADDFEGWLADRGYTPRSRKFAIRMLPHIDDDLRHRGIDHVNALTHSTLHRSWRSLIESYPNGAGTVRVLEQYLRTHSVGGLDIAETSRRVQLQTAAYADYLNEVRGYARSTISHHIYTAKCFLDHLKQSSRRLKTLTATDLERYVRKTGQRLTRASLQHDIGALRSFLRFLAASGKISPGLDRQIDTPRLYRLEQLPRSLTWETVRAFLRSIDRTTAIGLRDYTIFLLIATYGLRASEIVALTVDDIRWRAGTIRIVQSKTSAPLELPLTNEVGAALVEYLKRYLPAPPYRQVFLRMRAPIGPLKPTAVTEAFQAWSRRSSLGITFQGPHCIRHSVAVHLLKNGTSLKTIGDILGHRSAESTTTYLRLATNDLRDVALGLPSSRGRKEGAQS